MRNLKKFLALVLATLMVISAAATVSAYSDVADDSVYATAINTLSEYGIVKGIGNDEFGADLSVQRYQMALMMVRALEPESDWNVGGMKVFEDTPEEIYGNYFGAIAYARMSGIINGVDDTHFAPADGIKYCDALIMAVRALGYTVDVTVSPYWMGAYQTAAKLGLTKNIDVIDPAQILTRAQTAQVIYNMIKATPADGGATIEEKNFNAKGENNTTKAVITATANQSYIGEDGVVVNDEYVALQLLNADGTLGESFFAKFDKLGFDENVTPDEVIGYSVDLVNFKNGEFVKSVPNNSKVVLSTDIEVLKDAKGEKNNKLKIDGKTYWLVDEYTGSPLKNEIIIKSDDGKVATALLDNINKLYYNKNGDVVAPDGTVLAIATEAKAANGQTLYQLKKDENKDAFLLYTASELINVADVYNAYNSFSSVDGYADVKAINEAVQLTLFDDNNDGYYDRAISTPVYMSVFNTAKGNGEVNIQSEAFAASEKNVKFVGEKVTKGDVFYYTYNKQTNTVDVLGVVALENGTVKQINVTDKESAKHTITIDGTVYKFASANVFGAAFKETNASKLTGSDTIDKVVSEPAIRLVKETEFTDVAKIGATVKFYAYNGYIIYAEAYDVNEAFNYIAIKDTLDVAENGFIVDLYDNGTLVEDAVISEITVDGKIVKLSSLSQYAFSKQAYTFMDSAANKIYKGITLADGTYRLGVELVGTTYTNNDGKIIYANALTKIKDGGFELKEIVENNKIAFEGGISAKTATKFVTNDSTIFYLLSKEGKLSVVKTSGKNYTIYVDRATKIFTDKIGYSNAATKVIVLGYTSVEGFGIHATRDTLVYIPTGIPNTVVMKDNEIVSTYLDNFIAGTAEGFGLEGYEGSYYKYSKVAVDMSDGLTVPELYSIKKLEAGKLYYVDSNGVVLYNEESKTLEGETLATINTVTATGVEAAYNDQNQYKILNAADGKPILENDDGVTTIKAILSNSGEATTTADKGKIASNDNSYIKKNGGNIYYLTNEQGKAIDLGDGIFVMIIVVDDGSNQGNTGDEDKDTTITVNAKYDRENQQSYAANFTYSKNEDGTVSGTLTVLDVPFTEYAAKATGKIYSLKTSEEFTIKSVNDDSDSIGLKISQVNKDDGTVAFTFGKIAGVGDVDNALDAGSYIIEIQNEWGSVATIAFKVK